MVQQEKEPTGQPAVRPDDWENACTAAMLAVCYYAEHPSSANAEQLEAAMNKIKRLRGVSRWRGYTQ